MSDPGDGTVWVHLPATRLDAPVRTYDGTHSVANGVIASAHITKTS